jgi:hypothetical protein
LRLVLRPSAALLIGASIGGLLSTFLSRLPSGVQVGLEAALLLGGIILWQVDRHRQFRSYMRQAHGDNVE